MFIVRYPFSSYHPYSHIDEQETKRKRSSREKTASISYQIR